MKRFLAALLCVFLLIPAWAAASSPVLMRTDQASRAPLTGRDLAAAREQVIAELQSRPEWQETKIPSGQWTVGTDLPAGVWSFRHTDTLFSTKVTFSHKVGHTVKESDFLLFHDDAVGKAEPAEGTVLTLDGPVIMAPALFASVKMKNTEEPSAYTVSSLADIPYDELLRLQQELLDLIVLSPDCESVSLPAGVWTVGEDIPAGNWTARSTEYGLSLRHYKDTVTYNSGWHGLITPDERLDIILKDGWKLEVTNPIIFSPVRDP